MLINISSSDLNTILLGLRLVQFATTNSVAYLGDPASMPEVLMLEQFADYAPWLLPNEIDELCERLNLPEPLVPNTEAAERGEVSP